MSGAPTEKFGPYIVYDQLGSGGMATVHRAEAKGIEGFRRPVALKRMLPHVAANEDLVRSFVREARLASHLRHANVAQTYDLGKVGEIYFIAMELIVGRDLRQILRRSVQTETKIPVAVALAILNQICDALDYAHNLCDESGQRLGIIHRDVSPSNVIVSDDGVVKLIDFGIAKASAAGMQTLSGTLKGKFAYMAPEYIKGSIDARADLFALGVIAYELLTCRPLFNGRDDLDTLNRVQEMPIDPPSRRNAQVPTEIDDIVMTALARDPELRWQHATALRNALTTVTRRLGLAIVNGQVVEWIEWLFDQAGRAAPSTDPEPHISVHGTTDVEMPSYSPETPMTPVANPPPPVRSSPEIRVRAAASAPPQNRAIASPTDVGRAAPPEAVRRSIASPTDVGRAAPPEAVRRSIASPTDVGRAAPPEAVRRSIDDGDDHRPTLLQPHRQSGRAAAQRPSGIQSAVGADPDLALGLPPPRSSGLVDAPRAQRASGPRDAVEPRAHRDSGPRDAVEPRMHAQPAANAAPTIPYAPSPMPLGGPPPPTAMPLGTPQRLSAQAPAIESVFARQSARHDAMPPVPERRSDPMMASQAVTVIQMSLPPTMLDRSARTSAPPPTYPVGSSPPALPPSGPVSGRLAVPEASVNALPRRKSAAPLVILIVVAAAAAAAVVYFVLPLLT